jgi:hypothetical protein
MAALKDHKAITLIYGISFGGSNLEVEERLYIHPILSCYISMKPKYIAVYMQLGKQW